MNFEVNQKVICNNNKPLIGNDIAPPLVLGEEYNVVSITLDKMKNQHLNVGLVSVVNFVRSYETEEHLLDGDKVHWCHPSRFSLAK